MDQWYTKDTMRIFFSGIGGVGIGPLARVALGASYDIVGSDRSASPTTRELEKAGLTIYIGDQTGEALRAEHARQPIDYLVYTAALSPDHPELAAARDLGIPTVKRDGLLARIIDEKQLQLIAIAGTHGKTTTSGLFVWVAKQLGLPISYSVGTTLEYGPSGVFNPHSRYFIYECDEYDRNFLHFTPALSLVTSIDYDHPDSYPTAEAYDQAFVAFIDQSDQTLLWRKDFHAIGSPEFSSEVEVLDDEVALDHIRLPGLHVRQNAFLVERAVMRLWPDTPYHQLMAAINSFPGTGRRMEQLEDMLYSDYGHHPTEIAATLQMARELASHVVLVYQPHQNIRQHEVKNEYTDEVFRDADEVYWLPTYLTREDLTLKTLTPEQLSAQLSPAKVHIAELNDALWDEITRHRQAGHLVILMGAGNIDGWARECITYLPRDL